MPEVDPAPLRESPRWRFLGILLASLFGHAVCFYLLQVRYPTALAQPPAPPRIYLPLPGSKEASLVAAWADMADPALLTVPRARAGTDAGTPLPAAFVPSFAGER